MTTAHRPTYNAAVGTSSTSKGHFSTGGLVSRQFAARDLPSQLSLKTRKTGQSTVAELASRDLKAELLEKEQKHLEEKLDKSRRDNQGNLIEAEKQSLLLKDRVQNKFDDKDDSASDSSSDDSDSDDDETLELMRELEQIKKEREQQRLRKEQQEKEAAAKEMEKEMLTGNPLTKGAGNATMKRKWNHDVVFKNQARDEPEIKKRFVNDTIRNDFHRKFISKYVT